MSASVGAVTVGAEVRDTQPVSLTVTTDIEGKVVTLPTVTIEGEVHNVTQVVVYVDNVYNTSIPLAAGAETYMVAFGVTPGEHEVRVAGLDAYTNTEASQTVRFTYTPVIEGGTTPTPTPAEPTSGDGTKVVDNYVRDTIDAAEVAKQEADKQVQQASSSGVLGALSDITFGAFQSIDLVSATDGTGINKMASRFTLVSAGLAASVFPWSTYAFIQKLRFVPKLAMSTNAVMASMRLVGIALMMIPFVFIH
jgi:hypothetical protein